MSRSGDGWGSAVLLRQAVVVHVDGAGVGRSLHREAVIVLKTVVFVPGEHQSAGPGDPAALREELWLGRGQKTPRRRRLARSTKHLSERVRRQTSAHHVTHVAVAEACGGEGRRRGLIVVATVSLCRGEGGVVRLWGPASVAATCRRHRGGVACLGFRRRLAVVQVGVWGGLWGLRGPLVWGQNGTNFRHRQKSAIQSVR